MNKIRSTEVDRVFSNSRICSWTRNIRTAYLSLREDVSFFLALLAAAALWLDVLVEVVFAVVVGKLVTRFDTLLRVDADTFRVLVDLGFAVRPAGVIDVPGGVFARRAVERPFVVDFEQVAICTSVSFCVRDPLARVLNNKVALFVRTIRNESESGACFANAV